MLFVITQNYTVENVVKLVDVAWNLENARTIERIQVLEFLLALHDFSYACIGIFHSYLES